MTHTTPQLFATEYKINFEEDAAAYKALYLKAQADLRAQEEINRALANENRNLRDQAEHKIPVVKRGFINTNNLEPRSDVYYDGCPPSRFGGWNFSGKVCLSEKDEDGYSAWQLHPSFTVSG